MKVTLKDPSSRIVMPGREPITAGNLTVEKYQSLVAEYPQLKDHFVVEEEAAKAKEVK